jgi:hypothetical protein
VLPATTPSSAPPSVVDHKRFRAKTNNAPPPIAETTSKGAGTDPTMPAARSHASNAAAAANVASADSRRRPASKRTAAPGSSIPTAHGRTTSPMPSTNDDPRPIRSSPSIDSRPWRRAHRICPRQCGRSAPDLGGRQRTCGASNRCHPASRRSCAVGYRGRWAT